MTAPPLTTVSVIIPVFNTEAHLPACLASVVGQTHEQLEIILIDDGSTDRSPEICRQFAAADPRIRVIHQANGGVSAARNKGLDLATGTFVSLVDSDDWLEPTLYEEVLAALEASSAEVAIFEYFVDTAIASVVHRSALESYGLLDRSQAVSLSISSQNRFAWSRVFTRESIDDIRFRTDLHWGEETLFVCQVLGRVTTVVHLQQPLYHYVQSESSATRSGFGPRRLSGIDTGLAMIDLTETSYPHLVMQAYAYYGGILTQLLREVQADPRARATYTRDIRSRLRRVLTRTWLAREVPAKAKIRWLMALAGARRSFSFCEGRTL